MQVTRRELLQTIGGAAVAAGFERSAAAVAPPAGGAPLDAADGTSFAQVRAEFPRAARKLWVANAETHPFHNNVVKAVESYAQYRSLGPGEGRLNFTGDNQDETKRLYGALIG